MPKELIWKSGSEEGKDTCCDPVIESAQAGRSYTLSSRELLLDVNGEELTPFLSRRDAVAQRRENMGAVILTQCADRPLFTVPDQMTVTSEPLARAGRRAVAGNPW